MRRILPVLIAALLAFAGPRAATRPNVVLVTLDTTRADRMGFLGSTRGLTPALDALARESVVFTHAFSQAPITTVSHATILSGTYPPSHGVIDFGIPLRATVPYLPDILHQQGYRTAAFVGSLILDPRNGTAPGFDRGFEQFDAGFRLRRPGEDRYQTLERRGDEVVSRATTWLANQGREPLFLWVHLYDPHDPYDPPADLKQRFASAPYDGEIASVDRLVGRLVDALRARNLLTNTALVVTGDHGEALGAHGEATHGVFLYDETLHVPLLMRLPGVGATRVTTRVRLADIVPTILDAVGITKPSSIQGESMMALVDNPAKAGSARDRNRRRGVDPPSGGLSSGADPPVGGLSSGGLSSGGLSDRPVYAETEYPRRAFGWSPLVSWRAERFLYVRAPTRELYDVVADPGEKQNVASTRARVADGIDAELEQFVRRVAGAGATNANAPVDPAVAQRLAALGYVGGSGASGAPSGIDPKDRIATANALHDAVALVEDAAFQKAIPLLERVIVTDPNIQIAQLNLGVAYARQRQYAKALPPLRKAVELQPDVMFAQYELGIALYETGDLKAGAARLEIVAAKMPKWADVRYSLGSVYARIDRVPDAVKELRAALELEPRHFRANLLLGRILTLQGNAAGAVPFLQTAVDVQPSSAEARQFLAEAVAKAKKS